eukprot:scaffold123248_cov80-Attheya_sp.AAC.3
MASGSSTNDNITKEALSLSDPHMGNLSCSLAVGGMLESQQSRQHQQLNVKQLHYYLPYTILPWCLGDKYHKDIENLEKNDCLQELTNQRCLVGLIDAPPIKVFVVGAVAWWVWSDCLAFIFKEVTPRSAVLSGGLELSICETILDNTIPPEQKAI